jgi:cytochrome P450
MLIVTDPDVIAQFCAADRLLPKHPGVKTFLYPITGGYDLNCLEGDVWKFWRKLFNPGFSAGHVLNLVPGMVDEVGVFRDQLFDRAKKGEMFAFEEHALNLAIDFIGRVALYAHARSVHFYQRTNNSRRRQTRHATDSPPLDLGPPTPTPMGSLWPRNRSPYLHQSHALLPHVEQPQDHGQVH